MAIDFGERRIGIAISDSDQLFAFPLLTIDVKKSPAFLDKIVKIVNEQEVGKIIVGIPLTVDGKETNKSKQIKKFADKLSKYINIPIEFQDESLTTLHASEVLHLQKKSLKKNKSKLDKIAAALILRNYLESKI